MNKFRLASIACAALLFSTPALAETNTKEEHSDTWIKASIVTAYTLNRHLNPFEFDVDVSNQVVTLRGTVDEDIDKDLAEEIAESVDGVTKVTNEIKVEEDGTPDQKAMTKEAKSTARQFGERVGDATITAKVKSKLLWNKNTDGLDVDVDTHNGVVTLKGTADSEAASELAEKIAENTSDVRRVDNQLTVKKAGDMEAKIGTIDGDKVAKNAKSAAKHIGEEISDGWLNTKAYSTLAITRNVDIRNLEVNTKDGVVTLMGTADNDWEKERAEEVVGDLRGVTKVNNKISVEQS